MDFETLRIEKDIDKYLEVRMDHRGGVDWVSDIQTNSFLNICYKMLPDEEKIELLNLVEGSISMIKFDISESKKSILQWENRNNDETHWMINQHQLANIERKKKRKFIKKWLKEISLNSSKEKPKIQDLNKFSVAFDFANGRIDSLNKQGLSSVKIAKELYANKYKGYRPYISASMNRLKSGGDKNIFLDQEIIKAVINHCEEKNIEVISNFNCHNLEL